MTDNTLKTSEQILKEFESFLLDYFQKYRETLFSQLSSEYHQKSLDLLLESISYSLRGGGKRFRPLLCLKVGVALGASTSELFPFAAALEMIHTYSLIHDDLPSMDNDDYRRGQLTNHKKFGESVALLAGNSLLTESFLLVSQSYKKQPELSMHLVQLLAKCSGLQGILAGQIIDLQSKYKLSEAELKELHLLKTGALISAAVSGACEISGKVSLQKKNHLISFAEKLGLAFQVADDLLDADREDESQKSFVGLLGVERTKELLNSLSESCRQDLKSAFDLNSEIDYFNYQQIEEFINFNENRKK